MKKTDVLPNLLTLGNALCGFGAITFVAGQHEWKFWIASWLILAAMVFDALDGKVARLAKATSDFGAQLDSLCDMVTFGVAPAMMVKAISMQQELTAGLYPKFIWICAGLYVSCAALRLARFNVETKPDEASHRWFKGLPVPAAAAVICSFVILYDSIQRDFALGSIRTEAPLALPVTAAVLAAFMVSEIPFPHLLIWIFRGRRPFAYVTWIVFAAALLLAFHVYTPALGAVAYMLSGPAIGIYGVARRRKPWRAPPPEPDPPPGRDAPA